MEREKENERVTRKEWREREGVHEELEGGREREKER